ncbi:MAG: YybH family protein, partial [Woeseiaceae bacterium]
MSDLEREVKLYFHSYDEIVNSGDSDAFMATQASDVVWNPPDRPAVVGHDALRKYAEDEWFNVFSMRLASTVEDVMPISDQYVVSRGSWTVDLTPKDGSESSSLNGSFL